MIDYREELVSYIKEKLSNIDVRDAGSTFKQPSGDYATYYIVNEEAGSFHNVVSRDVSTETTTYSPLTIATVRISVRGGGSFSKSKLLRNSFDTISNKENLADRGIFFMGKGALSELPTLKNTKLQKGYLFTLTFSYDNSFTDTEILSEEIITNGS